MADNKLQYPLTFADVIRVLKLVDESPFHELELEMDGLKVRVVKDGDAPVRAAAAPVAKPEAAQAPKPAAAPAPVAADANGVTAPLAGTFYRAPSPGAKPFVDVGQTVKQGETIGILEVMKLMNQVPAPRAGVVKQILAKNEQFVEFGQLLMVIE